jgi:molecular chaperone GrpE
MSKSKDNIENDEEQLEELLEDLDDTQSESNEDLWNDSEVTIESLQAKLAATQAKADENWETAVRIKADMDNLRKRSEKQVEDAHKYAVQKFVEELLPVADSLEMGMAVEGEVEQIREGIGLTMNVLKV